MPAGLVNFKLIDPSICLLICTLSRKPHLEEEAMVVEQEETKEENEITHQPSQEEEIPREPRQGVQMYDRVSELSL